MAHFRRPHPDKKRRDWDSWASDGKRHRMERQAPFLCAVDNCVTIHRIKPHDKTMHTVEIACGPF